MSDNLKEIGKQLEELLGEKPKDEDSKDLASLGAKLAILSSLTKKPRRRANKTKQ